MAVEQTDLARMLGVTARALERAYEAKALADKAERMRIPLEMLETARERLPRMARRLADAAEDDPTTAATVAVELGLCDDDAPMSEALASLRQLAAVADLPTHAPPAPKSSKASKGSKGASKGLSETSQRVIALLRDEGPLPRADVAERLQMDPRGAAAVCGTLARHGHLVAVGDGYAVPNGAPPEETPDA